MTADVTPHGRPRIGEAGAAAEGLVHRPDRVGEPERPDITLIELDHGPWQMLGCSARGVLHSRRGEPRQDSTGAVLVDGTAYTVVCDGVGEFARSHEAADLVVASVLAAVSDGLAVDDALEQANGALQVLDADGNGPLATTVMVAATRPAEPGWITVDLWWVGDTSAWSLADGTWTWLNPKPAPAGFYSTATRVIPSARPVVERSSVSLRSDAVFFMTDGVGDSLVDIDEVRGVLASWWTRKPNIFEFAAQTSFARRGHMDDRTVVGIWPGASDEAQPAEDGLDEEPA